MLHRIGIAWTLVMVMGMGSSVLHAATSINPSAAFKADFEMPVITRTGAATVTVECGGVYTDAGATAMDFCEGTLSVTTTNPVNTSLPGVYTVRYNVSDTPGNAAAEVTRTVTVQDTAGPVITRNGAASVTVECGGTYADAGATALDACEGAVSVTTTNPVNTAVKGVYTVRYNAVDSGSRAAAEVTRTVTVQDATPPVISQCPANRSVEADENCKGTISDFTGNVIASDNCADAAALVITQNPAAGVTVAAGIHTITISVRDGADNVNTCTATFTVSETTAPVITQCAPNRQSAAGASCLAAVPDFTEDVQATDNCTPPEEITITQFPEAGTMLGLGAHTVTLTVRDATGNPDTCTAVFTVADESGPVVTITDGNTLSGQCGVPMILPEATAVDACDGSATASVTDLDGLNTESPAVGVYEVVYSAQDTTVHTGTATLTVTIMDTTAPEITLTGDAAVTVECGASYTDAGATATDVCDGDWAVIATGTVDTTTPGAYTLRYNVSDAAGNPAQEVIRTVTVQDTTAPEITQCAPPREGIEANADGFAPVPDFTAGVVASDNCAGTSLQITQTPAAGTLVEAGTHAVMITVKDGAENTVTCETSLTVDKWPWRYGDANLDGMIDLNDVTETLNLSLGGAPVGEAALITADVDGLPGITRSDMLAVFAYVQSGGIVEERPKNLIAQSGVNEIILLWSTVPHNNVRGYMVERQTAGESRFSPISEAEDPVHYDRTIASRRYTYRVAVVDTLGNVEDFSDSVSLQGNTLKLWAPWAQGQAGEEIIAPIGISSTRGLNPQTVSLTITYESARMEYLGLLTTVLSAGLARQVDHSKPGQLIIVADAPQGQLPVGEGRFFDLRMRLKPDAQEGCGDTALTKALIASSAGAPVATETVPGSICVGTARWGDLNDDGVISVEDAHVALDIAVRNLTPSAEQLFLGDLNGDRRIDAADAVLILRMANGLSINPEQESKAASVQAMGARKVSLQPMSSVGVPKGCSFVLPVTVDNAEALAGMDLVISFRRKDLQCDAVCPSAATQNFRFESELGEGYVRISIGDAVSLPKGATVLAHLIMTATGEPTSEINPAPLVRMNYVELKGQLGESFRWYGDVAREDTEITILKENAGACSDVPSCEELSRDAEGEGENVVEGEGEGEIEGEGEAAGAEGEGEAPVSEGEGEPGTGDEDEGGCLSGCGCKGKLMDTPRKMLGDWLLVGLALLVLGTLKHRGIKL